MTHLFRLLLQPMLPSRYTISCMEVSLARTLVKDTCTEKSLPKNHCQRKWQQVSIVNMYIYIYISSSDDVNMHQNMICNPFIHLIIHNSHVGFSCSLKLSLNIYKYLYTKKLLFWNSETKGKYIELIEFFFYVWLVIISFGFYNFGCWVC